MQKCYNCGKEVSDETLICPECGALVRRYTTPPPRDTGPEEKAPYTDLEMPGRQQPETRQRPEGSVWRDGNGRVHFRGGLTAWLAVCLAASAYMLLSYLCVQFIYRNQDLYFSVMASVPEFSGYAELLRPFMELVQSYEAYFVVQTVLSAVLSGCIVWLLVAKSRIALFVCLAADVLFGMVLIYMNPVGGLLFMAGAAVTLFWLRKYISLLR